MLFTKYPLWHSQTYECPFTQSFSQHSFIEHLLVLDVLLGQHTMVSKYRHYVVFYGIFSLWINIHIIQKWFNQNCDDCYNNLFSKFTEKRHLSWYPIQIYWTLTICQTHKSWGNSSEHWYLSSNLEVIYYSCWLIVKS